MKRTLIALSMFGLVMVTSSPVFAKNASNTNLPSKVVSFSYSTSAYTDLREKQDTSSHYIKNNSGFDLWVESLTSGNVNKTVKGYAIIPSGTERRIRNTIKESGYSYCKLGITSAKSSVSGRVSGKWNPDCAGSYPAAN